MDISSLLAQSAPQTVQQANQQALQQQGEQQNQQVQAAMLPGQLQQQQLAAQAAQQQMDNNKRALGISMLTPILNEPNADKQQALMKTLVPMFNRFVPDMQLDPENTDVSTIRALAQSQISPEKQAEMQQARLAAMGGMGGAQGTGIFPDQGSAFSSLMGMPTAGMPAGQMPPSDAAGAQGSPVPGPSATNTVDPASLTAAQPQPKATGVDANFLNQAKMMDPMAATMAEQMIAGTFEPESGKGQNDPVYVRALAIARRADPTLTAQSLLGRLAMVKNATSGKMYGDSVNINSVVGHLYDLYNAAPLTGNDDHSPIASTVANAIESHLNTPTSQNLSQYNSILTRAAPELNKFYVGGEGDAAGREKSAEPFASNLPVATIQNNAKAQIGLLKSKADALQSQYNTTMGGAASKTIIDPVMQAMMDDMEGKPVSPQMQQSINSRLADSKLPPRTWNAQQQAQGMLKPPSGTPIIGSPNDAAFKALPSGASFMSADGRMMVKH